MKTWYVMIPVTASTVTFKVKAATREDARAQALDDYKNNGAKYALGVDCGDVDEGHIEVQE